VPEVEHLSKIPPYSIQLGEKDRAELSSLSISDQLLHAWAILHSLAAETFISVKLVKLIALPSAIFSDTLSLVFGASALEGLPNGGDSAVACNDLIGWHVDLPGGRRLGLRGRAGRPPLTSRELANEQEQYAFNSISKIILIELL
jgi:hypothetical protein